MQKTRTLMCATILAVLIFDAAGASSNAQLLLLQRRAPEMKAGDRAGDRDPKRDGVRTVTIPITVRGRGERAQIALESVDFSVLEDGEPQQVLSLRNMSRAPLTIAVLIQDDVVPSIANEISTIGKFIRQLPQGSRVFVGYLRSGSIQVRQRFTNDLERAANALRIPVGSPAVGPYNPYVQVIEAIKRFESQPAGRRALLVVTDGLDVSRGFDSSSPSASLDLQRAINEAQRRSIAIYSFYAPTVGATANGNLRLISNAQGSLNRLSDETGGQAFFQGTGTPVSFDPFFRDLNLSLNQQYALTYLSTHPDKGFRRIKIVSEIGGLEIEHPTGYRR